MIYFLENVERRFDRFLKNLPDAVSKIDKVRLFDELGRVPRRLIVELRADYPLYRDATLWTKDAFLLCTI